MFVGGVEDISFLFVLGTFTLHLAPEVNVSRRDTAVATYCYVVESRRRKALGWFHTLNKKLDDKQSAEHCDGSIGCETLHGGLI